MSDSKSSSDLSKRHYSDAELWRRVYARTKNFRTQLSLIFFISLLAAPLALLPPLPIKLVVDCFIGNEPLPSWLAFLVPAVIVESEYILLYIIAALVVIFELAAYMQYGFLSILKTSFGERMVFNFRSALFHHAQKLSVVHNDETGTGDFIYRIDSDAESINGIIVEGLIPIATTFVSLAAMLFVIAKINLSIGLLALIIVPVVFLATHFSSKRLRTKWIEVKKIESRLLSISWEILKAMRLVRAYGLGDSEAQRFKSVAGQIMPAKMHATRTEVFFETIAGLAISIGTAAILVLSALKVKDGSITLGDFILIMSYLLYLYEPLEKFIEKITILQSAMASAERAFYLLDKPVSVVNSSNPIALTRAKGTIEFRNIGFAYPESSPVLNGVSFKINAGSKVGILGPTGAGKSTLMNLLMRFYDPQNGTIFLDDIDLREIHLDDLKTQFSVVLQDPILFSTTIKQNIAYGRPDATMEEIIDSAKAANAHGFIENLKDGYDTLISDNVTSLSGGERQRIALARAFLKNSPILILDEPTSALDIKIESEIVEAMERLISGRTTLIISHREATLKSCDEIFELTNGVMTKIST